MTPSLAVKTWGTGRPAAELIARLTSQIASPREVGMAHHDAVKGVRRMVRDGARVEQVES